MGYSHIHQETHTWRAPPLSTHIPTHQERKRHTHTPQETYTHQRHTPGESLPYLHIYIHTHTHTHTHTHPRRHTHRVDWTLRVLGVKGHRSCSEVPELLVAEPWAAEPKAGAPTPGLPSPDRAGPWDVLPRTPGACHHTPPKLSREHALLDRAGAAVSIPWSPGSGHPSF